MWVAGTRSQTQHCATAWATTSSCGWRRYLAASEVRVRSPGDSGAAFIPMSSVENLHLNRLGVVHVRSRCHQNGQAAGRKVSKKHCESSCHQVRHAKGARCAGRVPGSVVQKRPAGAFACSEVHTPQCAVPRRPRSRVSI